MITMGVTGGIGSGKSTFCALLVSQGAELFDADRVANQIMVSNASVKVRLTHLLGAEAYFENGQLNKPFISRVLFSNEVVLAKVGQIVHPEVQAAFLNEQTKARKAGIKLLVREAAIPPDVTTRSFLDAVIGVHADRDIRIHRVMERSNLTKNEVEARISAQVSDEAFRTASDYVVINNGSVEELEEQARKVWDEWVKA